MAFRGDLASISLADVFQNLKNNRQTGTLKLFTSEESRWIYFRDGEVACAVSGKEPEDCAARLLADSGLVLKEKLSQFMEKRGRKTLSEFLAKEGILDGKSRRDALCAYVEEVVFECFTWEDALFEFSEGPAPDHLFPEILCVTDIGLHSDSLMMEAARRMDEWGEIKKFIPSSNEMFLLTQDGRSAVEAWGEEDKAVKAVAEEFRQAAEFGDVLRSHGLARFDGGRIVAYLVRERFLRPLSKEELIEKAEAAAAADDHPTARRFLARVLDREPGNAVAREKLVHVHASLGEWEDASAQAKILARGHREAGNKAKAIAAYEQAVSFIPSDTSAHEILVDMYIERKLREESIRAARTLEAKYNELGMPLKAAAVYRKILAKWRKEVEIAVSLGEVLADGGKNPEAAVALRTAAQLYQRAGNERALEKTLERILELDPDDTGTRRHLKKVQAGALARRRTMKRYAFIGAIVIFVLFVLGFLAFREIRALLDERRTLLKAYKLIAAGRYDEAPQLYRIFAARHPFTLATIGASEKADEIQDNAEAAAVEAARRNIRDKLKPDISGSSNPGNLFIDEQISPEKKDNVKPVKQPGESE